MKKPEIRSPIVRALKIKNKREVKELTVGLNFDTKKMALAICLHGKTFKETAEEYGITKQAVSDLARRLYKKKYGEEYGKKKQHT